LFKHFGFTGESTFFMEVGEKLGKGFYIICTAIGTAILTFWSALAGTFIFSDKWKEISGFLPSMNFILFNSFNLLFIFGLIFCIYGGIGIYIDQNKQQEENKKLSLENDKLRKSVGELKEALNFSQEELQNQKYETDKLNKELVRIWLKSLKSLGLNSTERVTIYYEFDDTFSLLARYSINPRYTKIHRQKFPLNQGVIGKAWQHGFHIEKDCPSSQNYPEYKEYLVKTYGYEEDKIDTLTMKSCRYVAIAIVDAGVHKGVIAFESTDPAFLEIDERENKIREYCRDYQGQLSEFVRNGLKFDRETSIRPDVKNKSVEDDILKTLGNKI